MKNALATARSLLAASVCFAALGSNAATYRDIDCHDSAFNVAGTASTFHEGPRSSPQAPLFASYRLYGGFDRGTPTNPQMRPRRSVLRQGDDKLWITINGLRATQRVQREYWTGVPSSWSVWVGNFMLYGQAEEADPANPGRTRPRTVYSQGRGLQNVPAGGTHMFRIGLPPAAMWRQPGFSMHGNLYIAPGNAPSCAKVEVRNQS
jgi:hypothetical protein